MQQDNTGGNARTLQLQQDDYDISRRYIDSLNKSSQTPRFRPKDLSIDPVSMDGDKGALGQVSRYGFMLAMDLNLKTVVKVFKQEHTLAHQKQ
jgi:hypothetical protein